MVTSQKVSVFALPFLAAFTIENLAEDFFVPTTCLAANTTNDFWREVKAGMKRKNNNRHSFMNDQLELQVHNPGVLVYYPIAI